MLEDIIDIHFFEKKVFNIIYPGRNFELKAKTQELRTKWAKNLLLYLKSKKLTKKKNEKMD